MESMLEDVGSLILSLRTLRLTRHEGEVLATKLKTIAETRLEIELDERKAKNEGAVDGGRDATGRSR